MKQINKRIIQKSLKSKTLTENPIFSPNKVAAQLSLAWRSNQVEILKSNTVSQYAEAVIIDRNSKEHPQNELNKKELPQLKKHFT